MLSVTLKRSLILAAIVPVAASFAASQADAAVKYWDLNGTTAGSGGPAPAGTFDTTSLNWNTLADGTGATTTFAAGAAAGTGDDAVFSAGSDATGAFLVSQAGTINVSSVTVEEGEVTIGTAGALALGTTGNVAVGSGAILVTNSSARISIATGATSLYTLNGGTLRTTNSSSAGSFIDTDAGVVLGAAGGTFDYQVPSILNIYGSPVTTPTATSGTITGSGSLTKTGVGIIAIATPATYTGATFINGGEIRVRTNNNVLPVGTALTVNSGGFLNLNGLLQTVGSLAGNGVVGTGAGTLTVGNASNTTFAGSIVNIANAGNGGGVTTGAGKFTKTGAGTLTLTGSNTYSSSTSVINGTLLLANAASPALTATTSVSINGAGSTLRLGANDQINDAATLTLSSGNLLTGGFSEGSSSAAGIGALTLSGTTSVIDLGTAASVLAFADSSAATWAGTALKVLNYTGTPVTGGGIDQLYFGTTGTGLTAAQIAKITFYADAGATSLGGATLLANGELVPSIVANVPEPTTLAALAGAGVLALRRRRRA